MKQLVMILVILLNFIHGQGQNTFHKLVYTNFPIVRFTAVLPTDSCYYFTGTFIDTLSPTRTGVMFGKINLDGELQIANTVKHPNRYYFNDYGDIISTNDGAFVNVGTEDDSIARVVLYKFNHNGDTILTRKYLSILYPALNWLVPKEILVRPNGSFSILIGHESKFNQDFDISLLILNSDLDIAHYKSYGSSVLQEGSSALILDDDGGFIIGGSRNNFNLTTKDYLSQTYIIKTDSTGGVKWQYISPFGILQDIAKAMIKTLDGGLVVASGIGIEDPVHPTIHLLNWDALIFKLDADRNLVWSTPLRGVFPTTQTGLVEMVASEDGSGYVAVGKVADNVSGPEPMSGSWIVKVSPEGDSLWARYYTIFDGVDIDPRPYDMKQTSDGGYVIVGNTINLGQPAPGWIMKVDEYGCLVPGCHIINTAEETKPEVLLSVYPNPTADYLNFYLRSPGLIDEVSFRIVDVNGKQIKSFHSRQTDATFIVPVWDWPAGIYFLQYLEKGEVRASERFVVMRK